MSALAPAACRAMPKVLLHDHLDGGVRPRTIVELAAETGYDGLPTTDPDELQTWMTRGADRKDLVLYLETFAHTIGVMQTPDALTRVARECAEDLAADGVIYAEIRYAPEQHLTRGLTPDEVVAAVSAGFEDGAGDRIVVRTLIDAMRTGTSSEEIARLAVRSRDRGVVGFDLAGAEAGFPARDFAPALAICRDAGLPLTVHAGEAFGPASIDDALDQGALRIGHGVHVADDIAADGALGPVARRVHDDAVPLELCPTSNVHSGAAASIAEHPIDRLRRLGFAVTVNTDNRLMSSITPSTEWAGLAEAFGWTLEDAEAITDRALAAAFIDPVERGPLRTRVREGYAALR
ncbi:MAG TPA: adenosine deaminase [Actinomycetota bacterium]|nr:adenosine deaminase [Actinomycetota bacterium]